MGDESKGQSLLNKKSILYERSKSHAYDELRVFRRWLKWMCVDQSDTSSTVLSWLVFIMFAIVVPCLSHFLLACAECDANHDRPYDSIVQLSLSAVAALSFICLSGFVSKFGLLRFLFLDKLCDESETVRKCYMEQLHLCSVSLVAGMLILLRSAVRITHKAQAVTCLAAKWHACATIDSFESVEGETPPASQIDSNQVFPVSSEGSSDADEVGDEEDELDNTKFVHSHAYRTISFQKRQALVAYFERNRAGITLYGIMLDRSYLHTIFVKELALVLWLLARTIGAIT